MREEDEWNGKGYRPVVLDLLGPSGESMLPDGIKMLFYTAPNSLSFAYTKVMASAQTFGGFLMTHWGDSPTTISISFHTGAFVRPTTGLSATTGPTPSSILVKPSGNTPAGIGGTRRQSLAYDSYLDLLALFHNNGAIYDAAGKVVATGKIKMYYDGSFYYGWFSEMSVEESSGSPFNFTGTLTFLVDSETHRARSVRASEGAYVFGGEE